jgi:hypothetical protein
MSTQIGVVTEQGDLGLGFDVLTEQEQEQVREQKEKENKDKNGAN